MNVYLRQNITMEQEPGFLSWETVCVKEFAYRLRVFSNGCCVKDEETNEQ